MLHFENTHPSRKTVLRTLQEQVLGKELLEHAHNFGVTVTTETGINKGWVGQTLELISDLGNSNVAAPDGGDFELKSTRVHWKDGGWDPKETIKITNLNPQKILDETFEESIMWQKLSRLILVGCEYHSPTQVRVVQVFSVDVTSEKLIEEIRTFWEDVKHLIISGEISEHVNLGSFSDYIQLRPTGSGKQLSLCPITGDKFPARAFYATKRFIREVSITDRT